MTMNEGPTLQRIKEAMAAMGVMMPDEPRVTLVLFTEDLPGIEEKIRAMYGSLIKVQRLPYVPPGEAYVINHQLLQGPLERYGHEPPPLFEPESPATIADILRAERERLLVRRITNPFLRGSDLA